VTAPLAEQAVSFADELTDTIASVLPDAFPVVAQEAPNNTGMYVLQPLNDKGLLARIPLFVDGTRLADLSMQIFLALDVMGRYLKVVRSDYAVYSALDRAPLIRLDYVANMRTAPAAHWQFHAERGSLTHLLTLAQAHRPRDIESPHILSSLHIPVGGERFRPCLEDFLQFLVQECGVDRLDGWKTAVDAGRERWRRLQFRTVVRDLQGEAAAVLQAHGWQLTPPAEPLTEAPTSLRQW
jgi:hypothetical protein